MGGGGGPSGGGSATTQGISSYAQPEVNALLGASMNQIFNMSPGNGGYDAQGNPIASGVYDASGNPVAPTISGIKPYVPYSTNPSDYQAGFSPLQQQAQQEAGNLQVSQQLGQGTNYANQAAQAGMGTAGGALGYGALGAQQGLSYGQNATNPNAVAAYMNPYLQNALAPALALQQQQFGQQQAANQAQATQQGAYGGGRSAVMQGLNQQNQALAQNQLVGNAYNQAYNTANQNMQQAAQLGLQGAQAGLQGIAGAQNAANIGLSGANALNTLGNSQYNQQTGIIGIQNQLGAQQQAQQQAIINQAVQNYATAQQYPYQQLGFLSNMIQGLPVTQTSTQNYLAVPNQVSQLAGLGTAGVAGYKLATTGRTGGQPKDFKMKKFVTGGIASGVPAAKLDYMLGALPDAQLAQKADPKANDPQTAQAAQAQMDFRSQMRAPGLGAAPAGKTTFAAASGGIVAFGDGGSATAGSYAEPTAADYATNVASRAAALKDLYGQNIAAQEFKQKLSDIQASQGKENADQGLWRLMQAGVDIAGGTSPFALTNIGRGAQPAVAGMMEDIKQRKKEEFDMAKAQYEVGNNDYRTNVEIANNASKDYNAELNRQMEMGKSKMQAQTTIQAAQIAAGASLGVANINANAELNRIKAIAEQYRKDNPGITESEAISKVIGELKPSYGAATLRADTSVAENAAKAIDKQLGTFGNPNKKEYDKLAKTDPKAAEQFRADLIKREVQNQKSNVAGTPSLTGGIPTYVEGKGLVYPNQ